MDTSLFNVMSTGNSGDTASWFCMGVRVFSPSCSISTCRAHTFCQVKNSGVPAASRYYGELSLSFLTEFGNLINA